MSRSASCRTYEDHVASRTRSHRGKDPGASKTTKQQNEALTQDRLSGATDVVMKSKRLRISHRCDSDVQSFKNSEDDEVTFVSPSPSQARWALFTHPMGGVRNHVPRSLHISDTLLGLESEYGEWWESNKSRSFPGDDTIKSISEAIEVSPNDFEKLVPSALAYGRSGSPLSPRPSYLDFLVDMAFQFFWSAHSVDSAERVLSLVKYKQPDNYRALLARYEMDRNNINIMKEIIRVGQRLNKDVSNFVDRVKQRTAKPSNISEAMMQWYHLNRSDLAKKYSFTCVVIDKSVTLSLPGGSTFPSPFKQTYREFSFDVKFDAKRVTNLNG